MIRKMVLFPARPEALPDRPAALPEQLVALGLLGEQFSWQGALHYCAGEDFLALITFLGCAPSVCLTPPQHGDVAGDAFCHVRLTGPLPDMQYRVNAAGLQVRCRCGHREADWQVMLTAWENAPQTYRWTCPKCAQASAPPDLKWRHAAAFGRFFIEIWGIYPHEALPSEKLLESLRKASGVAWRFAYVSEQESCE